MVWDARIDWWTSEHVFFCDGWEQYILHHIQPGQDPMQNGFNGMEVFDFDDEVLDELAQATAQEITFDSPPSYPDNSSDATVEGH